jgi:predicted GIY-YIG superfamily endonuclease
MVDPDAIQSEADRLFADLNTLPFAACCPLTREFRELPPRPGIYAMKHRLHGILYIGKSGNVRGRLRGGHKALGWAFIDRYSPDDVRIGVVLFAFPWIRLSLQLEQRILRQARPPYNDRIAQED